jgi:hypothetical protein
MQTDPRRAASHVTDCQRCKALRTVRYAHVGNPIDLPNFRSLVRPLSKLACSASRTSEQCSVRKREILQTCLVQSRGWAPTPFSHTNTEQGFLNVHARTESRCPQRRVGCLNRMKKDSSKRECDPLSEIPSNWHAKILNGTSQEEHRFVLRQGKAILIPLSSLGYSTPSVFDGLLAYFLPKALSLRWSDSGAQQYI